MAHSFSNLDGSTWLGAPAFLFGLISLPFDTVFDVALSPVDAVGWVFGLRKPEINAELFWRSPQEVR
jgi:hypothetical protein